MPEDHDGKFHRVKERVSQRLHDRLSPRPRSSSDDAYLSYFDIRLMREDYDTIKDDWLTDNVIAFWEEYLEQTTLSNHPRCQIVLLRPSMAFMLMNSTVGPEELRGALPNMTKTTHIFLPINNNRDVEEAEGGTHWSLMLVSVKDKLAFHYDSMGDTNESVARLANDKLSKLLQMEPSMRFVQIEGSPQQNNGSDCGVFVCMLMKHLLIKKLLKKHAGEMVGMDVSHSEVHPRKGRRELIDTIDDLVERGNSRRSLSRRSPSRSRSPPRLGPETNGS